MKMNFIRYHGSRLLNLFVVQMCSEGQDLGLLTLVALIWLFAVTDLERVLVVQEKNGTKSLALGIKDGVRKVG
jgi:hypothetical protein